MISFLNFHLLLFILASIFSFTIPGFFLIDKSHFKTNSWEKLILGTIIGLISFTLISYLLIVANMSLLLIPIILIFDFFALKKVIQLKNELSLPSKKQLLILFFVFAIGIIGQMAVIAPSGAISNGDIQFWSAHGHDGMWHVALMEELKKGYPLQNPAFAGEKLVNYHFFSDIAPAIFSKFFSFSNLDLYFRYFPLLYSLLLGSLAYYLGKKMGGNFGSGIWAVIFTYFAGSFGYIVTWVQNKTIGGESLFWATQVHSSVGNPPQIAAFVILLAFLILFLDFLQDQKSWLKLLICVLLASSLAEFKVYGGIILIGSLITVGVWQLLKERRIRLLILATLSSLISAALYLPNAVGSTGFLIWEPWWYIRTMVVIPGRLNLLDWELRRQTYLVEGNIKRVLFLESTSFFIYLFGNLGMRFAGVFGVGKILLSVFKDYFSLLLILILTLSFIFPMFFLQKGVASNSIQFMQYFILLMGIIAAITIRQLTQKLKPLIQATIGLFIILLAIPTQVGLIYSFYTNPPLAKVNLEEQVALKFLNRNTPENSIILTPPYNKYLALKMATPPLWGWFDTAYVPALSARRSFLSDTEQVDIMGYDLKERLIAQEEIFTESTPVIFIKKLKDNHIDYLYFPKLLRPQVDLQKTSLVQIFTNNTVEIWKVN